MADSKFKTFLAEKKLDVRRLLAASHKLETLTPEDRAIKRSKRKPAEGEEKAKDPRKPRSGRPVTPRALNAALGAGTLSGPTKTRILRAVNHLLDQKKEAQVDLRSLF